MVWRFRKKFINNYKNGDLFAVFVCFNIDFGDDGNIRFIDKTYLSVVKDVKLLKAGVCSAQQYLNV